MKPHGISKSIRWCEVNNYDKTIRKTYYGILFIMLIIFI